MIRNTYRALFFLFSLFTSFLAQAQTGIVDFRDTNFKNKIVTLNTNWQFHAYQLLGPGQLDTAYWESVVLPQRWDRMTWKGKPMTNQGLATYRLRLIMPETHIRLGFRLYEAISTYKLWINDRFLYESGKVGTDVKEEEPDYNNGIIAVPFNPYKGDTLDIVLQVSNWHYVFGGIKSSIEIGDIKKLHANKERKIAIGGILLGAIFLIGVSQLILFVFRRKNYYYLCLVLVSLIIFFRLASVDEMLIKILIPSINHRSLLHIRWITTYLAVPATLLFIYAFFTKYTNKWILIFYWVLGLSHSLIALLFPYTLKIYYAYHYHALMIIGALYILYICIRAAVNKELGARTLVVGLLITIPFLIIDILYVQFVSSVGNLIGWGIMVFFLALFTVTAKRFSLALTNEEKLTAELSEMNKNLEQIVEQRTRHIEDKNILIEEQKAVLQSQHDSLKQLLKDQEALMAMVAHDLKAPLNRAAGLAEVMSLSGELSQDQLELNKKIIEVANSGSKLVEQLTMLQKYEHDTSEIALDDCDVDKLIFDQLEGFSKTASDKHIRIISKVESPIRFKTNKEALTRIIDNLLSNAIKFSPINGKVIIETHKEGEELVFKISDEGPGFSSEDKKKVFGKFQKLSAQPTGGEASTGLGLSIVKVLIDKLDGKIDLESEKGKGTTFTIHFPE